MRTFFLPCNSLSIINTLTFHKISDPKSAIKSPKALQIVSPPKKKNSRIFTGAQVAFCSKNDVFEEIEELELLGKPAPISHPPEVVTSDANITCKDDKSLEPFLRFFKPRDTSEESDVVKNGRENEIMVRKDVIVEYYEPKPGEFAVGVVVSGNENRLDVNIGADMLGTMLTKEVLPLYDKEMEWLLCDVENDAEDLMVRGKMGIVKNDDAVKGEVVPGRPVVETGTVIFAQVLGRTLSGRPLLSARRYFRRIAWHRVRQIKQLNEPILVRITEWNTGGLLTRIEGLRAFLPKGELINRVNNFTQLKEYVGKQINVQISRIDESNNEFILSEKEAWEILHLTEGTLLQGTVRKIFPYGAQIRIGETSRWGLLHISNVTQARVTSVSDLLTVGEKVKVLVVKSMFPDKISLSIADLESKPGLFMSNKERVFSEAEEMAKKYRQKLTSVATTPKSEPLVDVIQFDDEASLYSNWKWFKFERENNLT